MNRAVFLDRDGVINRVVVERGKPYPPRDPEQLVILPGVREALQRLRKHGFQLVVITNQPDVARGLITRESVELLNRRLLADLALDAIMTCYHDGDQCECRKPKPGALLRAALERDIDLDRSFMVGDRWRDVEAGQRAGCRCLFVDSGYDEKHPSPPYVRVTSLAEAAELISNSEQDGSWPSNE